MIDAYIHDRLPRSLVCSSGLCVILFKIRGAKKFPAPQLSFQLLAIALNSQCAEWRTPITDFPLSLFYNQKHSNMVMWYQHPPLTVNIKVEV